MTRNRFFTPWAGMAFASIATQNMLLAVEAQQVIALRLAKIAMGGPGVQRETELMVSEKVKALGEAGQMVMSAAMAGASDLGAAKVTRHYRAKVRANRKRLSK